MLFVRPTCRVCCSRCDGREGVGSRGDCLTYAGGDVRVCARCGEWNEEIVVSVEGAAICSHCGYRRSFLRLPLFQVTGASGSGKSGACRGLPAALPECVVLDQDITLSGLPWEEHRRNWLRVAVNIHQGGHSVVFVATQLPQHYEQLPERVWFSAIHYLALVCDEDTLAERLRPSSLARHHRRGHRRDAAVQLVAESERRLKRAADEAARHE